MQNISIFGRLTTVQMFFHTLMRGKRVGQDMFGNIYYRGKPRKEGGRERRWVMYKGTPEASSIPPEWHGWIHHQTDIVPANDSKHRQNWQKPHKPNMTGTNGRYLPPSLKGGARAASTTDYTPWTPADK